MPSHCGNCFVTFLVPLYNGRNAGVRSASSVQPPVSHAVGLAAGTTFIVWLSVQRDTVLLAASVTAAGESTAKSQEDPASSVNFLPSLDVHPIRAQVATIVAEGPRTTLQMDPRALLSLAFALP